MNPRRTGPAGILLPLLLLPFVSCRSPGPAPAGTGVGEVARDIAGVDLDGVAFKLSDYRGKVVFLDFWGDW